MKSVLPTSVVMCIALTIGVESRGQDVVASSPIRKVIYKLDALDDSDQTLNALRSEFETIPNVEFSIDDGWLVVLGPETVHSELAEGFQRASIKDHIQRFLRRRIGPPLKSLHAPVDRWLGSLPMSVAVGCAVGLYVIAVIWVWGLRREFVFRGAPDQQPWRDLRIWATIVVLPYVAIYVILGR